MTDAEEFEYITATTDFTPIEILVAQAFLIVRNFCRDDPKPLRDWSVGDIVEFVAKMQDQN